MGFGANNTIPRKDLSTILVLNFGIGTLSDILKAIAQLTCPLFANEEKLLRDMINTRSPLVLSLIIRSFTRDELAAIAESIYALLDKCALSRAEEHWLPCKPRSTGFGGGFLGPHTEGPTPRCQTVSIYISLIGNEYDDDFYTRDLYDRAIRESLYFAQIDRNKSDYCCIIKSLRRVLNTTGDPETRRRVEQILRSTGYLGQTCK